MRHFKLLSWNILGPDTFDAKQFKDKYPEVLNWDLRFKLLTSKIISFNTDILCLQEIAAIRKPAFIKYLTKKGFQEASYETKGKNGGVLLLYKTSKFILINNNHTHLPIKPSSQQPGAAAWATLQCKQTHQRFIVVSIHMQPKVQCEQLSKLVQQFKDIQTPIIIAGDLNTPYSMVQKNIIPYLSSTHMLARQYDFHMFENSSWTRQPPHNTDSTAWKCLDHVIYSNNVELDITKSFVGSKQHTETIKTTDLTKLNLIPNNEFPSDHLPIVISFYLK